MSSFFSAPRTVSVTGDDLDSADSYWHCWGGPWGRAAWLLVQCNGRDAPACHRRALSVCAAPALSHRTDRNLWTVHAVRVGMDRSCARTANRVSVAADAQRGTDADCELPRIRRLPTKYHRPDTRGLLTMKAFNSV